MQRGDTSRIVDSIVVAVMVPFSEKMGATLNGYRIGTYRWERAHGDATPPPRGFVEVRAADAELAGRCDRVVTIGDGRVMSDVTT